MIRFAKFFSLLVIAAAGAGFYATPLLTVDAMRKAAAGGDEAALARFVDRAALKESVKERFHAGKKAQAEASSQDNPLAAVGVAITATLMTPVADLLTTPENIGRMLRGEHPQILNLAPAAPSADDGSGPDTAMAYEAFDRVLMTVRKKGASGEPVRLVFRRDGVTGWKLTAIRLPEN